MILHFEGFLPESEETYRYGIPLAENATGPDYRFTLELVQLGGHEYIHSTWFFDAREAVEVNPDRELTRTARLLDSRGYALPDEVRMSRFVRVVAEQARHELILFYLEPLPSAIRSQRSLFAEGSGSDLARRLLPR